MLFKAENISAKYGNVEVLHKISFNVDKGEIVAILGANGAGKTTSLMCISNIVNITNGKIFFDEKEIHNLKAHKTVEQGVIHVPEGRRVFATLSVRSNLNIGAFTKKNKKQIEKMRYFVYELFPILKERKKQLAGTLSGGEQQMLAIGRGLMAEPKLLLLDEPSLGLAPIIIKDIFNTIKEINNSGVPIILVEQNAKAALKLAHRGYVLETGRLVLEDSSNQLLNNPDVQKAYLGGS
ncbi:MAG: ABC transporter ATP-binding protein [Desulfobacteraceae bacterium 4572_130]|nr:MAG: ABC transporter ATP-binding protein [Desulfobacteraceae bacterium 4572_130]